MIRHYKKRIVNINSNIIIASLTSIFLAAYPVSLTKTFIDSMVGLLLSAFLIDAIIDLGIFGTLHYVSNYTKKNRKKFGRDLFTIQIHRAILSIIFFLIAVGLDFVLMVNGIERTASFVISYTIALIITRSIHTIYGLRKGIFKNENYQ